MKKHQTRSEMHDSYLEYLAWSSCDETIDHFDDYRFSQEAIEQSRNDCDAFLDYCDDMDIDYTDLDFATLGANFALSRNGHGAGFFDLGRNDLQKAAKTFGTVDIYLDNGELHIM